MNKLCEQLERYLLEMHQLHLQLIELIKRKQQAMRDAKPKVMNDLCVRENVYVQQISELEKQRQALVGKLTEQINSSANQPMTLTQIANFLPEPQRERLLVLHQQLRDVIQQTKSENAIAKQAGQTLLNHMKGMMQMVTSAVGPGTYSRQGMSCVNPQTSGTISLTG